MQLSLLCKNMGTWVTLPRLESQLRHLLCDLGEVPRCTWLARLLWGLSDFYIKMLRSVCANSRRCGGKGVRSPSSSSWGPGQNPGTPPPAAFLVSRRHTGAWPTMLGAERSGSSPLLRSAPTPAEPLRFFPSSHRHLLLPCLLSTSGWGPFSPQAPLLPHPFSSGIFVSLVFM